MIKKLFKVITGGAAKVPSGTTRQVFKNIYSLDAPAIYIRTDKYNMFQLTDPNDELAVVTASAYEKQDGTLDEFSEYRFGGVEHFYKPVSEIQLFEYQHASGKLQEFEGIWPDESEPTYYVVSCIETGNVFVSLTFVTTRDHYSSYHKQYDAILESTQPCP